MALCFAVAGLPTRFVVSTTLGWEGVLLTTTTASRGLAAAQGAVVLAVVSVAVGLGITADAASFLARKTLLFSSLSGSGL